MKQAVCCLKANYVTFLLEKQRRLARLNSGSQKSYMAVRMMRTKASREGALVNPGIIS